jgi:nickel transport protein
MKILRISILLIGIVGWHAASLQAHGVSAIVSRGGIVVSAAYDSGDPMSYAKVTIAAPDAKMQFQSGRTDRNGRFCFFPDSPGVWKVMIKDGMGHGLTQQVAVGETLGLSPGGAEKKHPRRLGKAEKAVMGLSILFGVTGFIHGWRIRRPKKNGAGRHD